MQNKTKVVRETLSTQVISLISAKRSPISRFPRTPRGGGLPEQPIIFSDYFTPALAVRTHI